MNDMNLRKEFMKYVSQNVLGMIGISVYILADTYFISKAVGANGITALNLVLPIYNLIFAFGQMIGVGSAIRFSIEIGTKNKNKNYFSNAIICATILGVLFSVVGIMMPHKVILLMGGDDVIIATGKDYTRIFMTFAPFFMWNNICNAFVRNDGNPSVAMAATLVSSMFNICFDYVLMFPCQMGMSGAALATALSPLVGVAICCTHFFSKKNTIKFKFICPDLKKLIKACTLGVSAFIGEISSGVITIVFNFLILGLEGNVGVAAYGVVANLSLVVMAIFNGVSQGAQPLISRAYGKNNTREIVKLRNMAIITGVTLALAVFVGARVWSRQLAGIFNSENDEYLLGLAQNGIKLYFIGFIFESINVIGANFYSSIDRPRIAFLISIMRGFVAIVTCAIVMSAIWKLNGVWLAFPVAELITCVITFAGFIQKNRTKN